MSAATQQQRLERLRADVKKARNWAGDNLPAKAGLEIIIMLERAIQESRK